MAAPRYFSQTYAEARTRFLQAIARAAVPLESFENPVGLGPQGETLVCDVALFGPDDARNLLVLISGTHGVEGFTGSGAQIAMIEAVRFTALPARTAVLVIHAINPYGFAWLRRVNEDNVDLNRNSIDYRSPPATPDDCAALVPHLVPVDWEDWASAEEAIRAFIATHGLRRFQEVVSRGQYTHPDGLFYGGTEAVWSTRTFQQIMAKYGRGKARIALIDFHSGLGPTGYGEPMYTGEDPAEFERAVEWYGPEVTSMMAGSSSSVVMNGPLINAAGASFAGQAKKPEITPIVLEYGTEPAEDVLDTLRAEAWLHMHGDINFHMPVGRAIKRRFRDVFYIDTVAWKKSVVDRALEITGEALAGLAG